ncbi:MAG: DUF3576 domain-containing protein [Acetobacteraceae bacterium]|nr:DUF3576 domain-containing protein [Acetobacteraceae bacterium]
MLGVALTGLAACGASRPVSETEYQDPRYKGGEQGRLFGEQGMVLGVGGKNSDTSKDAGGTLGVNAYLWRGALDTLSFMPLASADPFGGVIITDWYQPPAASGERFKATAYILGRQLRADGVRVNIYRQVEQNGAWVDAPVSPVTVGEIENKVLARARELREQSASRY